MRIYLNWILLAVPLLAHAVEPEKLQRLKVPAPPWPQHDERGMANQIGPATLQRCAWHMSQPGARLYELSHVRSATMQMNEGAEPGQQGTQIDALGHFALLRQPWDGKPPLPVDGALYYGGFTQSEVKPTPDSPLLKLGMEKAPPLATSAVLLDAKAHVGGGQPMKAGALVTAKHIEEMLKAQGLSRRGILPGDVVYVHTGWGDYWQDPYIDKRYYAAAPGLAYDAARYLGERRVVAIGLDTPFVDPVPEGMLAGTAGPAPGTPPALPFAVHHHMLTQMGIHHVENAKLDELARDGIWVACTMILPLLEKGAAGSAIRPVAIGAPKAVARR